MSDLQSGKDGVELAMKMKTAMDFLESTVLNCSTYNLANKVKTDLLGEEFMLKGKWFRRKDSEVVNSRKYVLQCSHCIPIDSSDHKPLPCVLYSHGNMLVKVGAEQMRFIPRCASCASGQIRNPVYAKSDT